MIFCDFFQSPCDEFVTFLDDDSCFLSEQAYGFHHGEDTHSDGGSQDRSSTDRCLKEQKERIRDPSCAQLQQRRESTAPAAGRPVLAFWHLTGIGVLGIVFDLVWGIDAWFKWQSDFIRTFIFPSVYLSLSRLTEALL